MKVQEYRTKAITYRTEKREKVTERVNLQKDRKKDLLTQRGPEVAVSFRGPQQLKWSVNIPLDFLGSLSLSLSLSLSTPCRVTSHGRSSPEGPLGSRSFEFWEIYQILEKNKVLNLKT